MSVYEFSDHVRVAIQHVYLIKSIDIPSEVVLYIRRDCRSFMFPSFSGDVRYLNKYFMTVMFFYEAVLHNRKIFVTTGPEAASGIVKKFFSSLLKLLKNRLSVFVVVRDLKNEKGRFLLDKCLYSNRSLLAVETEELMKNCSDAGFSPDCYIFPTPISHDMMPRIDKPGLGIASDGKLKILITGSLDSKRRNYDVFLKALSDLNEKNVPFQVIVGGHSIGETSKSVLKLLKYHCDDLISKRLLTDVELDSALLSADAIVCLNRPEFYTGIKGSGAIGDSFFSGKKLLCYKDLSRGGIVNSSFYIWFNSHEELAKNLYAAYMGGDYLNLDKSVIDNQYQYFSGNVRKWLSL